MFHIRETCSLVMVVIALLVTAAGCSRSRIDLKEEVAGSDSVAINFFKGDGTMDTVVAVKILRDTPSLLKLTELITGTSTGILTNCGYDGSIHFFKNNMVIQDIDFRMGNADCSQFSFIFKGKKAATILTGEARGFLTDLKSK